MADIPSPPGIIDGHNDTLLRLHRERGRADARPFHVRGDRGHVDLPRMREGGMIGGFFAMFPPDENQQAGMSFEDMGGQPVAQGYALDFVLHLFALLRRLDADLGEDFRMVRSVPELRAAMAADACFAIAHIEDASPLDEDLDLLPLLYDLGLRSLGLVWSRPNAFGHGVPFTFPSSPDTGPGLTPAGRELVQACNAMGVLVDLSHLNEKGFWDVAELSDAPLVATHSCVHALSASARNLTDRQLDAVAASGGVVGINYNVGFLRQDGQPTASTTSLTEIVRHAAYMVERMGIEHVALGSDFDGATMPGDLPDAASLPHLMQALAEAGFQADDLRRLAHGNWIRVLEQTWK